MYKKNTLFLLFLINCFLQNRLQCMGGRFSSYVTKKLPAITALLKNSFKKTPTVPAGHVIYNKDGSEVTEHQFNEIKDKILKPNEFPTALKNPNYNPEADEANVIKEKLDEKYQHEKHDIVRIDPFNQYTLTTVSNTPKETSVKWIPQTLHDLFTFKYSQNKNDEYKVNQEIHNCLLKNTKKSNESDAAYYQRLAEPLIDFCVNKLKKEKEYRGLFQNHKEETVKQTIKDTINIEFNQHKTNPTNTLLYRGNGVLQDFDKKDSYDIGKNGKNATYCQNMAFKEYYGIPKTLSYSISLLSSAKLMSGECPLEYVFYNSTPDLQVVPIAKKEFFNKNGAWYVNPDYDYFNSVHEDGLRFHPRSKAHSTNTIISGKQFNDMFFKKNDPRILLHKTDNEALNGYKRLKKYQIHNAIGVTPYTAAKIKEAQQAFAQGKSDRNSWMKHIYAFLTGYLPK